MKIEDAVGTTQKEIELSGEVSAVNFGHDYLYYEVRNDGNEDIYVSTTDNECTAGEKGVVCVPAGTSYTHCNGYGGNEKIYLLGKGKATVIAKSYSENSFKAVKKGGGCAVAGASYYTLNNAVDYPLLGLNLYGKSTQGGTPTPENPVDIVSVGDSGSVAVQACGKNLFDYSLIRVVTANGVEFTNNNDGSFTISGSKTDVSKHFSAYHRYTHEESISIISQGNYTVSGVPKEYGGALFFYMNAFYNGKSYYGILSTSNKPTCDIAEDMLTDDFYIELGFYSNANKEILNGTFYPQLEKGSAATDFEPYKGNTASITSALPLCGIPVSEGGNYTDSNGQQWICDELIYNADGTGKIIKNIRKYTFTGTDEGGYWLLNSTVDNTKKRFQFKITDENIKAVYDTSKFTIRSKSRILCDKYKAVTSDDTWKLKNGIAASHTAGYIAIYDENYATISTINDWIAYLAANPVTVIYQLNKPQEIELTAAEMAQLRELQTFNGITNITNGSGADMDVKVCTNKMLAEYVNPITTGLQKQIDELKAAVLSLGGNV